MTAWAVETALIVSVLIVLVLLFRRPVANAFGARAAYALWAAPLVRAVLPPLPAAAVPVSTDFALRQVRYDLIVTSSAAVSAWTWADALLALWMVGAIVFLSVQLFRHHRFVSNALQCGRGLVIDGIDYDVVASPAVHGPMATGLIHPLIFVPFDFEERFTPGQQQLALLHEQMHHRRGDIWASAAALIVTAFLWFNPLAHLALGAFRRDMEAACDSSVLTEIGQESAPTYAETILRSAARPVPRSLCALTSIDELKGRLKMLKHNHGLARRVAGLFVAAALTVTGTALAAPTASKHPYREEREVKVVRDFDGSKDHPDAAQLDAKLGACPGEKIEVTGGKTHSANREQQTRIVLCGPKGASSQQLASMVQDAIAHLGRGGDMDSATKADLTAKLQVKVRELRSRS